MVKLRETAAGHGLSASRAAQAFRVRFAKGRSVNIALAPASPSDRCQDRPSQGSQSMGPAQWFRSGIPLVQHDVDNSPAECSTVKIHLTHGCVLAEGKSQWVSISTQTMGLRLATHHRVRRARSRCKSAISCRCATRASRRAIKTYSFARILARMAPVVIPY